jgi:hypothetical protein
MYVRIVTFQLADLPPDAYQAHALEVADTFTAWPGLLSKVWLADAAAGTYGGIYVFDGQEAADASRRTDAFAGMVANAHFTDLSIAEYEVLAAPTAVTGGPLGARVDTPR